MIGIIISIIVAFFPIKINSYINHKSKYKRLFFRIKLYSFLPVFSGSIEIKNKNIKLLLPFNIQVKIPFKRLFNVRKTFYSLQDYHIKDITFVIETGSDNCLIVPSVFSFVFSYIYTIINKILLTNKPYLQLKSGIFLYEKEEKFNFYLKLSLYFNLFMVILTFVKIIMEKILNGLRKTRQQNKQSS